MSDLAEFYIFPILSDFKLLDKTCHDLVRAARLHKVQTHFNRDFNCSVLLNSQSDLSLAVNQHINSMDHLHGQSLQYVYCCVRTKC